MMSKIVIFFVLTIIAIVQAGVLPAAFVAPYATSYNAHHVNHAVAAPLVAAAPYVAAAPAPVLAAAPAFAHAAPAFAHAAPAFAHAAYFL